MDIEKTIRHLEGNNMKAYFVGDSGALISLLGKLIPEGSSVGCGDSVTLEEAGVFEYLRGGMYRFYDKHEKGLTKEEKRAIYLRNFSCDTFVTGMNAVTEDGKLFNIDGNGSRVAPMLYGPRQVIGVVGRNKIVPTVADAIWRARQVAAPLDAKRLGKKTPCISLDRCIDCKHAERICNDFVLIAGQFNKERIKVIIVDEVLGY